MKILVTGAAGFVGRNLVASLRNIQKGYDRVHNIPGGVESIYEYDRHSTEEELEEACREADFVFNLAGVNRPKEQSEFIEGNFSFASTLLDTLKKYNNKAPVMLSSSIQATLIGRYGESEYGKSKLAGEELFFKYSAETGAPILVYRFANLIGKWCRPNYNSVVATFCNNIANDLPIRVDNRDTELTMVYIDDLVEEMIRALNGQGHHCQFNGLEPIDDPIGKYCYVPISHKATLGRIVDLLHAFHDHLETQLLPEMPDGSFEKKLYSMYLSYLPEEKTASPLKMNCDDRGSFTELLHFPNCGQISVNISKPGVTKGEHWHHSKWEFFIVVKGTALICERRVGFDENGQEYPIREYTVSGNKIEAVYMLPGYTHNIVNLSNTDDLVTIMYANETFDPNHPDTFWEKV